MKGVDSDGFGRHFKQRAEYFEVASPQSEIAFCMVALYAGTHKSTDIEKDLDLKRHLPTDTASLFDFLNNQLRCPSVASYLQRGSGSSQWFTQEVYKLILFKIAIALQVLEQTDKNTLNTVMQSISSIGNQAATNLAALTEEIDARLSTLLPIRDIDYYMKPNGGEPPRPPNLSAIRVVNSKIEDDS